MPIGPLRLSRSYRALNCRRLAAVGCVAALAFCGSATPAACAQGVRTPPAATAAATSGEIAFAPGVMTTIEPDLDRVDAISVHDLVEIRADKKLPWQPISEAKSRTLSEMAAGAVFPQQVWGLEFSCKPLRMIEVDVPQSSGRMQRRLVWYLVYRVRNTGVGLTPKVQVDGSFETEAAKGTPVRFLPEFTLVSQDRDKVGEKVGKAYLDRLIPAALEPIRRRELSQGTLLDSVAMAEQSLPVESGRMQKGVWGVAMWDGVDPQMDFFSVFVGGLTNAYKWSDPAGAYQAGDPPGKGRQFARKTLQLNYWRPGDELEQNEREIRYGTAPGQGQLYDSGEGVAHQWVYR